MKRTVNILILSVVFALFVQTISACPLCRAQVENEIYSRDFLLNLFVVLLPVFLLAGLGTAFYFSGKFLSAGGEDDA